MLLIVKFAPQYRLNHRFRVGMDPAGQVREFRWAYTLECHGFRCGRMGQVHGYGGHGSVLPCSGCGIMILYASKALPPGQPRVWNPDHAAYPLLNGVLARYVS